MNAFPSTAGLFAETDGRRRACSARAAPPAATPYFPKVAGLPQPGVRRAPRSRTRGFGPHGTLWSCAVQDYPPPPPAKYDKPYKPYAHGVVDLADGLRVLGRISDRRHPKRARRHARSSSIVDTLCHDDGRQRGRHLEVPAGRRAAGQESDAMRDVAVLGLGMHPWGKFADKSVTRAVSRRRRRGARRTRASRGARSRPSRRRARASPAARAGA